MGGIFQILGGIFQSPGWTQTLAGVFYASPSPRAWSWTRSWNWTRAWSRTLAGSWTKPRAEPEPGAEQKRRRVLQPADLEIPLYYSTTGPRNIHHESPIVCTSTGMRKTNIVIMFDKRKPFKYEVYHPSWNKKMKHKSWNFYQM